MDGKVSEARPEKKLILALICLLAVLTPDAAAAQDASGTSPAPAPPPPPPARSAPQPAGAPGAAQPTPTPAPTAESLVKDTLAEDIASASYYELVTWCRNLGLDDAGSRKDLQNRLAQHYNVKLPLEAVRGRRTVIVKSARESQYYTQTDVNEKYVVLRGGVDIEVRDEQNGSVQEVKADNVTYNQTRHTISAEGNVSYTLVKGKETQNYTGSRFSFDLDTSEGVFYNGATTKEITQSDQKLTYTFSGSTISRLENNTIIMQDGSFTTSQPVDPFWQIRAENVWILAPSEWAVDNAVLMVGRVPLLYIPAFFWPGDELFFHPNPGYDNRTGMYIQTTTYLIGRKTKQDNPFSFLQVSEEGGTAYKEEIRGLFLRKIPGESPPPDNGQDLKFLLDVYSRLGGFIGMTGDFPPLANFRTGIGISRSIFVDPTTGLYSPYYYQTGQTYWNASSFFGLPVPFRFGLDGSIQNTSDVYNLSWKFAYYSDPTFIADFYTRSEGLNFSAALPTTTQNPVQSAATAQQPNLSWDYVSRLDLTKSVKSPYIQSMSFPTLNMNVTWQSRDQPGATSDPLLSDPGHTFYFPTSITFPNISFSIAGEFLKIGGAASAPAASAPAQASAAPGQPSATPAQASIPGATPSPAASASQQSLPAGQGTPAAPQAGATGPSGQPVAQEQKPPAEAPEAPDPGKGLRTPLQQKPEAAQAAKPGKSLYREPALWPDASQAAGAGNTLDVTYQLQPRAVLQHTFDSDPWTNQQAIDYSILYQTLDTGGSGQLSAASSLWDRLMDVTTSVNMDGEYRQRFNPDKNALNSTTQPWQSLLQSDLLQDRLTFQGSLQTTVRPLLSVPSFSGSTVSYHLGARMYQLGYTGTTPTFTTSGPSWTADAISDNTLQSNLLYQLGNFTNTFGLSLQVLPQSALYTALEQAGTPDVSGKVQVQGGAPISSYSALQPFVFTSTFDAGPNVELSEALQFDPDITMIQTATSQAKLWWLTGSFIAQSVGTGPLVPSTLNLGLNSGSNPQWFWRDRIKVDASVQSSYNINLQTPTTNELDFTFNLNFSIYKFLDLTFSSTSYNNQTFLYFAPYNQNPLTDLLKSFNFFNIQDRYSSNFKIRSLAVTIVHHLRDWDISFQYSGSPQLNSTTNTIMWTPTFTLQIKWLAVPILQSNVAGDQTGITTLN